MLVIFLLNISRCLHHSAIYSRVIFWHQFCLLGIHNFSLLQNIILNPKKENFKKRKIEYCRDELSLYDSLAKPKNKDHVLRLASLVSSFSQNFSKSYGPYIGQSLVEFFHVPRPIYKGVLEIFHPYIKGKLGIFPSPTAHVWGRARELGNFFKSQGLYIEWELRIFDMFHVLCLA